MPCVAREQTKNWSALSSERNGVKLHVLGILQAGAVLYTIVHDVHV